MEAGFLTMSTKELDRLEVLQRVCERRLKQVEAAGILRITPRQLRRLVERFKQDGAAGLISRSRGKPSNNRLPEALSREAIDWVRRRYSDFGPTFAAEKLRELHQVKVSVESLRGLIPKIPAASTCFRRRSQIRCKTSSRSNSLLLIVRNPASMSAPG